ncbi:MAG: hypothetical protein OEU26_21920 [Candidatus Tectomicrobia bacterium]|nr:hypothetical protein [Candidatus Tectomicrobia bacterium]
MKGYLHLTLTDNKQRVLVRRSGGNAVMRSGGELIARLFSGAGAGITHMGVGTNDAVNTDDYGITALSNEAVGDIPALEGETETAIAADVFTIVPDDIKRVITVMLRATLPATAAVGTIREAGLLSISGDERSLYNRIVFDPVVKGDDHDLTMFWEVSFPYGDLQWF